MDQTACFDVAPNSEDGWAACGRPSPAVALPSIEEVLDHTTDCIVILDDDWCFKYLNRRAREVLGRGEDLTGLALHEVFKAEHGTAEWKETQRAARQRKHTSFEFLASHLQIWFEVHVHPLAGGLQIYFRDVTNRREAERALAQREEALRLALEAVGDAAWDWNLKTGRLTVGGRQVASLGYGSTRHDGSVEALSTIIHRDDVEQVVRELRRHLAGRSPAFGCKFRLRSAKGEWHWTLSRGRVIERDPITNWATRMVGTSVDIACLSRAAMPRKKRINS